MLLACVLAALLDADGSTIGSGISSGIRHVRVKNNMYIAFSSQLRYALQSAEEDSQSYNYEVSGVRYKHIVFHEMTAMISISSTSFGAATKYHPTYPSYSSHLLFVANTCNAPPSQDC